MTSATGASARIRMKRETVYGTAPAGNYFNMPFTPPVSLGAEQPMIDDPLLGQGRDPIDPTKDAINVSGDIGVPIDLRYIGLWLTGLLGDPVSSDQTTHHQHIFKSGGNSLPSYAIEIAHPNLSKFFMHSGIMVNSLAINAQRAGQALATIGLIGQDETIGGATGAGTPQNLTLTRFSQFNVALKRNGSALGAVLSTQLNYTNNLDPVGPIGNNGLIDAIDPTVAALTGTLETRFRDTTLLDDSIAGTPFELDLEYTLSATQKLLLNVPRVFLSKPKVGVNGPGGINVSFAFQGAYDPTDQAMLTATLLNDLDGTQYE